MSSIPNSFNPSDYEFLLKSVAEGNLVSKAESLKRLNTLVGTDKKQFAIYAKRVVVAIQDLLCEPKEDLNLLAGTLVLEIINLNPRDIEYYIRTKLLKNMVRNLGDTRPQIRKTSHYCLLAYVKTYKTFDQLIQLYINYGFDSESWQLRQKSINSFQSILIMEMKYLNWSSPEFKRIVEELLARTKDDSQYVQKAAEQCLVSICKCEEVRNFSKRLPAATFGALKDFCHHMIEQGMLAEIKLFSPELPPMLSKNNSSASVHNETPRTFDRNIGGAGQRVKAESISIPQSIISKQGIITRIEEMRKKTQTPMVDKQFLEDKADKQTPEHRILKKTESVGIVAKRNVDRDMALPSLRRSIQIEERQDEVRSNLKSEKAEGIGRKLIDDLRNEKDWKVRLEAIEELQAKFNSSKGTPDAENIAKSFLHILIKLLGDPNFKVALIALKLLEDTLAFENINQSPVVAQLVDKITDGKIALRQNISKLIRNEFHRTGNKAWLNELMGQLRKTPPPNSNIKEEIINILSKITSEASEQGSRLDTISACLEQIVDAICPLMDDLKTKIKIKTLDLLILLSLKTGKIQLVKSILASKLNQVYFQMYLERITKQIKNMNIVMESERMGTAGTSNRLDKATLSVRRHKVSGNTTSSTLRKYSSVEPEGQNPQATAKTALLFNQRNESFEKKQEDATSLRQISKETEPVSPSKNSIIKSYRKKNFDYKSTQYSAFSLNNIGLQLPPFSDPEKQLKNIMTEIKSDEWQTCSEALTKLRRIIENHSELLNHGTIRQLVPEIMRLVQSLRSSLSKNAVITINDLSNKVKRLLDSQIDLMYSKLLKKTLDANSFISEEVRKALNTICQNCNEGRVVSLLLNSHTSRAVPIKVSIVNVIEAIVFVPRVYEKQLQKIVGILVNFMSEGSLEVREKSKIILAGILNSEKGEQVMRQIPADIMQKINYRPSRSPERQESKITDIEASPRKDQMAESRLNRKKREKIVVFPEQFDKLETLLEQCESSDWKNREKNMSAINETIIEPYPKEFSQHKLGGRVMDVLSKQIGDPNVKVACNALRILQQICTKVPEVIEHNLSVLMNQIFNCFGSHKPDIKALSEQLFQDIASNIERWMLVQHMCNGALYGLQKSRPVILARLTQILPSVYAKGNKKTLISKNVYPLVNKLAEENKPENHEALAALIRVCDMETQGQFVSSLKPKAIQLFNQLKEQS